MSTKTLFVTVFLATSALMFGQVSTGSLAGTITDPGGAAIPNAKVVTKNTATGVSNETVTSGAGLYVFPAVPVGIYEVAVEQTGFKRLVRSNIEIRIAQRQILDLALEVGDVQQSVTVADTPPLLESTTSERGQNLSKKFMDNLPLFTGGIRNPRNFITFMPGVNAGAGEQSVSGSGGRSQEVLIDGASALNVESSAVFNFPSAEMFSEFKMLQSNYSAEYGRVGGGIEIYVAKSGTNWIHGAAFHNMRRDIWFANQWARNAQGLARPKDRFNETGGAIGGPIFVPKVYDGRNKTFWYFTYTKDIRPVAASTPNPIPTVPTALMKQGNFSQAGVPVIYDPSTTSGNVRLPFPGNIIPQDRFSRVARNVIPLIPDPTRPSLANNFDFVNTQVYDRTIWSLKFDHAITASNRVSYFYSNESELNDLVQNLPGALGHGLQNFQKPFNHRVNHDYTIRPTVLMHTTFGYSKTQQQWQNPQQVGAGSRIGIPNLPTAADAMPRVQFQGAAGLTPWGVQDGKVRDGAQNNLQIQLSQGYTWLRGKHEFKFGWEQRWFETLGIDNAGSNGLYVFNRAQTALPTALTSTGHEFASLLLGGADNASSVILPALFDPSKYYYTAGYFQDNFKISPRLTLNLGVRYEVPIGWHVPNGYSHIDLKTPNPGADGRAGALVFSGDGPGRTGQKRFYPTDWSNISPRLGFAYRLFDKTVIRGGWSIYYQGLSSGGCGCRIGFTAPNQLQSDGLNAALNWDNGIPASPSYRPPPNFDPAQANFLNVQHQGPNAGKSGRIYNWSLDVQHEIKNFLIDIGYQGNRGTRLNSTIDLNQLPVSSLSLGSTLQAPVGSPAANAANIRAPFSTFGTRSAAQALRPYPQYLSVNSFLAGVGHSWYDALQAKVERRFGSFQFMGAYTWSKTLGYGHFRQVFGQGGTAAPQDYYNYPEAKSFQPFDQPHVLNILASYELPFGRGKKFMSSASRPLDMLVGGWTISSTQRYFSGNLIQLVTPGNPLGNGVLFSPQTKANWAGGDIRTGIDRTTLDPNNPATRWFNPGVFTAAGQYQLGTAAYYHDDFRQPPVFQENLSIVKRTVLVHTEKNDITLTYRADAFNLFNRTNFGGVVGTVGNANFGRPTAPQNGPRFVTMGLRLEF